MKVFVCTDFTGHWPVGTSAVMIASTIEEAGKLLRKELEKYGLDPNDEFTLTEILTQEPKAVILNDGNY